MDIISRVRDTMQYLPSTDAHVKVAVANAIKRAMAPKNMTMRPAKAPTSSNVAKVPDPPSFKPPKQPEPPKSFAPKKTHTFGTNSLTSGATDGTLS